MEELATSCSDSPVTSKEQVACETVAKLSQLKVTICPPTFRLRKLKNRGALLILVWNYLVTSVFYHLSVYKDPGKSNKYYGTLVWCLTLPIAGWLADNYCNRYKLVRLSMWTMWLTAILSTFSLVMAQMVEKYSQINKIIVQVLLFPLACGFGGYQANVILFGIDQLHDASTEEITSFISWYV